MVRSILFKHVSLVKLGWAQIHYLDEPIWTFTLKRVKNQEKSQYLIDNKRHLCEHGLLHPMTARKGKYISHNVYTSMEDTLKKIGL